MQCIIDELRKIGTLTLQINDNDETKAIEVLQGIRFVLEDPQTAKDIPDIVAIAKKHKGDKTKIMASIAMKLMTF